MCFSFSFASSNSKKRKSAPPSPRDKKRRDGPPPSLRGDGRKVVAEVDEKRASAERPRTRTSRDSPYREKEDSVYRQQSHRSSGHTPRNHRSQHRAPLNVQVPGMTRILLWQSLRTPADLKIDVWHRPVVPETVNTSDEMLLNPRPHRSQHHRQRHTSQKTLRGHGKRVKSKKSVQEKPGWKNPFSLSPERPSRRRDQYQSIESPPHTHRSHRQQHSPQASPESSRSHQRQHRSRQQHASSGRQPASNTSARREPDRRFAVLAATNTALEDLRREAFLPSPPPRRERLRRYQGVTIPAASIPYTWDCVSSQTSNGNGEPSSRSRRGR